MPYYHTASFTWRNRKPGKQLISLWLEEARGKSRPKIFPKTLVPVSNSHSLVSPKLLWHLTRIAVSLKIPFCSDYFFIFGSKLWSTVSPQRLFLGSFEKVMCHRSCVATQPGCGSWGWFGPFFSGCSCCTDLLLLVSLWFNLPFLLLNKIKLKKKNHYLLIHNCRITPDGPFL